MTAVVTEPRLRFESLGYRFDVACDDRDLELRVANCCHDLARQGDDLELAGTTYRMVSDHQTGTVDLLADADVVVRGSEPWHALAMLLWHVNQKTTLHAAQTHTVVHAAAAALNGRGILLPAPMESGKTTTVTGLVLDGFDYLTDEAAAIHPDDLHVEPFPKSLSIDDGSWGVLDSLAALDVGRMPFQWSVPVNTIPAPSGTIGRRCLIDFVVFPRYEAGAHTQMQSCTPAQAVLDIARSTFHFLDEPERNLRVIAEVARQSQGCYRLVIGDLETAVRLVRQLIDS